MSLKSSDYGVVKTADLILAAARHRLTIPKMSSIQLEKITPKEKKRQRLFRNPDGAGQCKNSFEKDLHYAAISGILFYVK